MKHHVRTWRSWHRWVTLSMLAMAFLAVTTADQNEQAPPRLISLTLNQFRRLFDALVLGAAATNTSTLKWSIWRPNTKTKPAFSYYHRRPATP